jgi:hypothetical protein
LLGTYQNAVKGVLALTQVLSGHHGILNHELRTGTLNEHIGVAGQNAKRQLVVG